MKVYRRKLSALLAVILIIGTMAIPAVAATPRKIVSGGTTKANATELKLDTDNIFNLKSSTSIAWFKFKTENYYANYNAIIDCQRSENDDRPLSKNVRVVFQRANGSTICTEADNGNNVFSHEPHYNLQPNTWYYVVIKNPNRVSGRINLFIYCDKDEDRNTKATAFVLSNAKTHDGHLNPAYMDIDYYKFVPTQTGTYRVIVRANDKYRQHDYITAYFLRNDGSVVVKKDLKNKNALLKSDRHLTRGRTYYIKVVGHPMDWTLGEDGTGNYKVRITKQ